MKNRLKDIWNPAWIILFLFTGAALITGIQSYVLDQVFNPGGGTENMKYGNYIIFKQAWYHLLQGKDLYAPAPGEQADLFKYSPTFALLFGSLSILPDLAGLLIWNLVNALLLYFAIMAFPGLEERKKYFILIYVLIEMIISLQNSQSNGLVAGLLVFSFVFLERGRYGPAALLIAMTVFIKIFGLIFMALFLLYGKNRGRLFLYTLLWMLFLFLLPLPFTGFSYLKFLYGSWFHQLLADQAASLGLSVMGWLSAWFRLDIPKMLVVLAGSLITATPLLLVRKYHLRHFRILLFSLLMVWVVIFNHKAESPTFIIAMTGVALWFFSGKMTVANLVLAVFAFILTSLSSTDLFMAIRYDITEPYVLKAFPCILIWGKMVWDLWRMDKNFQEQDTNDR